MKDAHLSILVATSVLTCWDGFSKVQKKKIIYLYFLQSFFYLNKQISMNIVSRIFK